MDGAFDQPTRQFSAERYFPGRKMFGGRFVLERRIGRGGMGEVWLASDNELGRDVALKFAPAEVANDPKSIAELRREVIAGLELSHPRIARVYDLQVDDGEAAISMECVKGKSLSDLQAETEHGFFETDEIAGWIDDVKDALEYAHTEAKRTHRDVKPKNILVDAKTGRAKLVDFGISKRLSDSFTRNTGKDSSGSLAYMSPQQMMGEKNSEEDDWYSLGATVYELLTGAPPFFRGDVRTQIERVVPPSMTERRRELVGELIDAEGEAIPQDWEDWVARMLSKKRGRMEEAVRRVEAPPLPEAVVSTPPPLPPQLPPQPQPQFEESVLPPPPPEVPAPVPPSEPSPVSEPPQRAMARAMKEAAVETSSGSDRGGGVREDILETGIWGDGPKRVKAERAEKVARELKPMTGGQGLVWAGVMALLHVTGVLALKPVGAMADAAGQVLRMTGVETILVTSLALGVWAVFRRHGKRAVVLALVFVATSAVFSVGRELCWSQLERGRDWDDMRGVMYVFTFFFPLLVAVALLFSMGLTLKVWLPRLVIAGVAAGLVNVLVAWFFNTYGQSWSEWLFLAGPLFVGAIFGVVSGLSMVRSRKVTV